MFLYIIFGNKYVDKILSMQVYTVQTHDCSIILAKGPKNEKIGLNVLH